MPVVIRTEFALALNQVCSERSIDPEVVIDSIKAAILAAFRKDLIAEKKEISQEELDALIVEINKDSGEARIFDKKKDITPPGFGRIAAQTAKQVILQRIREAEKSAVLKDYTAKVGNIVNGMVLRFDGPNIIVDIVKAEAVMPPQEQIPTEHYKLNQRLAFYIEGIRETMRGNEIIVSRSHKGLIEGLFKREVPEVLGGAVEIKVIAREAGSRTKMAVYSSQAGVDPVGSCVGQKGVRVQSVIAELPNEKIDVIQYNEDPARFIASALSPAKDIEVILNTKKQTATAILPDDQLSLGIGKEGQNVRLAAKLTGWKIDIKGKSEEIKVEEEKKEEKKPKETKKKVKKASKKKSKE